MACEEQEDSGKSSLEDNCRSSLVGSRLEHASLPGAVMGADPIVIVVDKSSK